MLQLVQCLVDGLLWSGGNCEADMAWWCAFGLVVNEDAGWAHLCRGEIRAGRKLNDKSAPSLTALVDGATIGGGVRWGAGCLCTHAALASGIAAEAAPIRLWVVLERPWPR